MTTMSSSAWAPSSSRARRPHSKLSIFASILIFSVFIPYFDLTMSNTNVTRKVVTSRESFTKRTNKFGETTRNMATTGKMSKVQKSLTTTMEGGNGSYGNMFDILARRDIIVYTIEINTDGNSFPNRTVVVDVYTQTGPLLDIDHTDSAAWIKIVSSLSIISSGRHVGTLIPVEHFLPVEIPKNARQSFFVTLGSPDLRYTNVEMTGGMLGDVCAEDEAVNIFVGYGIGVKGFPHASSEFLGRIWNGILHYSYREEVAVPKDPPVEAPSKPAVPMVFTDVVYTLSVEKWDSLTDSDVIDSVDATVNQALVEFLSEKSQFLLLVDEHELSLLMVQSLIMTRESNGYYKIDTTVSVSHDDLVPTLFVRQIFLQQSKEISDRLIMDSHYVGTEILQSDILLSLEGIPNFADIRSQGKEKFHETVFVFLKQEFLSAVPPVNLQTVTIMEHSPKDGTNGRLRRLSSSDVEVIITGEYQPPPNINLDVVVTDSFNNNGESFVRQLAKVEDFSAVKAITSRPKNVATKEPSIAIRGDTLSIQSKPIKSNTKLYIIFASVCLLAILALLGLFCLRMTDEATSPIRQEMEDSDKLTTSNDVRKFLRVREQKRYGKSNTSLSCGSSVMFGSESPRGLPSNAASVRFGAGMESFRGPSAGGVPLSSRSVISNANSASRKHTSK